jgi:HK97 family phage major capsid protein
MNIAELTESRNKISNDMHALHNEAEAGDRAFTPEERDSWDAMGVDIASIDSRIETTTRAQEIGGNLGMPTYRLPVQESDPEVLAAQPDAQPIGVTHRGAFDSWARRGVSGCSSAEQAVMMEHRAQATSPDAAGGFTVPEEMANSILETMKQYGGIANVCNTLTTSSGNILNFPGNDDTGNIGELVAENIAANEQDLVFTNKALGSYKFSSKMVRLSKELLNDESVSLQSYLTNALGKRLGRAEAGYFATGTGSGEPEGLMTGATITKTATGASSITYGDILALEHSVDPAYRTTVGTFVFNDATLASLMSLTDSDGRPLWMPALSATMAESAPATILGHRYQIDQGVADIATGNRSVAFGDMSAFTIRRTLGVDLVRLEERYAEYYQVAFLGWTRCDSALLDTSAVAVLVQL